MNVSLWFPESRRSNIRCAWKVEILGRAAGVCVVGVLLGAGSAAAQVVTIDSHGNATEAGHAATVDRRFAQIDPTHVPLSQSELDAKTRLEIIRIMQSEQGFAMRPFPGAQGADAGGQRQAGAGRRALSRHGHQGRHFGQAG